MPHLGIASSSWGAFCEFQSRASSSWILWPWQCWVGDGFGWLFVQVGTEALRFFSAEAGERTENGKNVGKSEEPRSPGLTWDHLAVEESKISVMSHEEKDKFSTVSLQLPSVNLQGKFLLGKWLSKICFACQFERCTRLWVIALHACFHRLAFLWLPGNPLGDTGVKQLLPKLYGRVLSLNLAGTGSGLSVEIFSMPSSYQI